MAVRELRPAPPASFPVAQPFGPRTPGYVARLLAYLQLIYAI
jgi:hypothetical protein